MSEEPSWQPDISFWAFANHERPDDVTLREITAGADRSVFVVPPGKVAVYKFSWVSQINHRVALMSDAYTVIESFDGRPSFVVFESGQEAPAALEPMGEMVLLGDGEFTPATFGSRGLDAPDKKDAARWPIFVLNERGSARFLDRHPLDSLPPKERVEALQKVILKAAGQIENWVWDDFQFNQNRAIACYSKGFLGAHLCVDGLCLCALSVWVEIDEEGRLFWGWPKKDVCVFHNRSLQDAGVEEIERALITCMDSDSFRPLGLWRAVRDLFSRYVVYADQPDEGEPSAPINKRAWLDRMREIHSMSLRDIRRLNAWL